MSKSFMAAVVAASGAIASSGLCYGQLVVSVSLAPTNPVTPAAFYLTSTNPDVAVAKPLWAYATNKGAYGVAGDNANRLLYSSTGTRLNVWTYGSEPTSPTLIGGMYRSNTANGVSATGFDDLTMVNGNLYGWTATALTGVLHGIYKINTTPDASSRCGTTLLWGDATGNYRLEGLCYNPKDGLMYGVNDASVGGVPVGLYSVDAFNNPNATPQFVAAFPDGLTRMDGLAIDPISGKFYMSQDYEAASELIIAGFDLATKTYDDTFIGVPFNDATHRGTGLSWAPTADVPEPSSALLAAPIGLVALSRRRRHR